MMQTTTPTLEGKSISRYHGVVTGEAILGANIFKDFFAGIQASAATEASSDRRAPGSSGP